MIGYLYGAPGTYKSFVAIYLANMVAAKKPAFGRETTPGAPDVIYVAAEGSSGLRKRLDAAEIVHGFASDSLGFVSQALDLRADRTDCDELLKTIKDGGWSPSLIVVDTLARSFGAGNENASEDMGAFINVMDYIGEKTGATVLIVHHSGKDATKGGRGHSSFLGAVHFEIEVTKTSNAPKDGPGVEIGRASGRERG